FLLDFLAAAFFGAAFFLAAAFLGADFFAAAFLGAAFFGGTLAPSFLASDNPIAMACLGLVTFLPEPLRSLPSFFSCITFSTFSLAFFEYFAIVECLMVNNE